jgi:hypothetical protein
MQHWYRFALVFLLGAGTVPAFGAELLTNGGFENGLNGWTVANENHVNETGNWFANSGTTAPLSGKATIGAESGSFYAMSDQTGPGAHVLGQSFTVAPGSGSVVLSFDMFVNDWDPVSTGAQISSTGLDFTQIPNQHGRVDLLTSSATPFSTNAGDVLENFYIGADSQIRTVHDYKHYTFDITSLVGGGGTFQIRFAEVDNQLYFNQGVDNVSIIATPQVSTVPTPGAALGGGALLAGIGLIRWMRRGIARGA